jgi:hypothetical protein
MKYEHKIRDQFMSFGANGALVLEGKKNGVTNKLQVSHVSHMKGMHCVMHQKKFAINVY